MVKEVMLFGNGGCPCFIGFDWGVLTSGGYTKKALKKGGVSTPGVREHYGLSMLLGWEIPCFDSCQCSEIQRIIDDYASPWIRRDRVFCIVGLAISIFAPSG